MALTPGLEAAFRYTVTGADTAAAVGSGDVPVLATPRVLALAEQATVAAVAGALEAGATTVGTRADGHRPVARGLVTRVVVDAAAFARDAGAGPTTT